jgi:hypothetical protein
MFKRIIWFTAGAAAGVAGMRRVEREIAERRARLEPESLANSAVEAAGRGADRVRTALADGRREMRRVAHELEASHDPSRRPPRSRRVGTAGTGSSVSTPTR